MPVVRISMGKPIIGGAAELERLYDRLEEHLSQQPGYIMGFCFFATDWSEETGRLAVWESGAAADRAAQLDATQALRSQIHALLQPGHLERLCQVRGTPRNLPTGRG